MIPRRPTSKEAVRMHFSALLLLCICFFQTPRQHSWPASTVATSPGEAFSTFTNTRSFDQTQTPSPPKVKVLPIFYDSSNNLHRCRQYHAEQPTRISECVELLRQSEKQCISGGGRAAPQPQSASKSFELLNVAEEASSNAAASALTTGTSNKLSLLTHEELDHAR
jgi:DNA-binding MurR/RpiR family transcriptional regulator